MSRRSLPLLLVLASVASFGFSPAEPDLPDPDPFPLGVCVYVRNAVDQCVVVDPSGS